MGMFPGTFQILDISQPVDARSACFPGDTPFSRQVTLTYQENHLYNLTALTMSPHVGTHADAPIHIHGNMQTDTDTVGSLPLSPYIGPAMVIDVATTLEAISLDLIQAKLDALPQLPPRILFRTAETIRYDIFEKQYASFSVALVEYLAARGVVLMGLDTPSVDPVDSKTLEVHHALLNANMVWLENLDLTLIKEGEYFLIALPLKFMELEASPVRAVLLSL